MKQVNVQHKGTTISPPVSTGLRSKSLETRYNRSNIRFRNLPSLNSFHNYIPNNTSSLHKVNSIKFEKYTSFHYNVTTKYFLQRKTLIKFMSTTNEPPQQKDNRDSDKPQNIDAEKTTDQKSSKSKEHEAELLEALQKLKQQFNQLIEEQQKGQPYTAEKHDASTQSSKSTSTQDASSAASTQQQKTEPQPTPQQEVPKTTITPDVSSQAKPDEEQSASDPSKVKTTRPKRPESAERKRSMMQLRSSRVGFFDQMQIRYAFRTLGWDYNEFLEGAEDAFLSLFDLGKTNVDEIQRFCNEETFYRFKKLFSEGKDTSLFNIDPGFLTVKVIKIDDQPDNDTRVDVTVEYLHNPPTNHGKPLLATVKWTGKVSENDDEIINPRFKATGLNLVW